MPTKFDASTLTYGHLKPCGAFTPAENLGLAHRAKFQKSVEGAVADEVLTGKELEALKSQYGELEDRFTKQKKLLGLIPYRVSMKEDELSDAQRGALKQNAIEWLKLVGRPNLADAIANNEQGLAPEGSISLEGGDLPAGALHTLRAQQAKIQKDDETVTSAISLVQQHAERPDWLNRGECYSRGIVFKDDDGETIEPGLVKLRLEQGLPTIAWRHDRKVTKKFKSNPGQLGYHIRTQGKLTSGVRLKSVAAFAQWWRADGAQYLSNAKWLTR